MRVCKECSEPFSKPHNYYTCNVCRNGVRRYGLNRKQQQQLLEEQSSKCALCFVDITLHARQDNGIKYTGNIDHNHKTGKVRGILCHSCNVMVGYIENHDIDLDLLKSYASK